MTGNLTQSEITNILKANIIGRIGCSADGANYVVPVSYVFRGDHILCHSYGGRKIDMMRKNPAVCFEVDEIDDYNNWRCIITEGVFEELREDSDILEARKQFSDLLMHIKLSETALPPSERSNYFDAEGPRSDVSIYYLIRFDKMSGRYERME